jgi:hypothetical protein
MDGEMDKITLNPKPVTVTASSTPGQDEQTVEDNILIQLIGPDGKIKEEHLHNTVTTAGKNGAADQILASPTLGKPTHMAIGTGTGGTTALTTEIDRNALGVPAGNANGKTRSGAVVTMQAEWLAGDGTGAITEAGIFDASSTGNMWTYASFTVINKAAGDTLKITWTLTFA